MDNNNTATDAAAIIIKDLQELIRLKINSGAALALKQVEAGEHDDTIASSSHMKTYELTDMIISDSQFV